MRKVVAITGGGAGLGLAIAGLLDLPDNLAVPEIMLASRHP
jgi:NADP-dependent 3-hydroxy acid dehydrogenase YdfG